MAYLIYDLNADGTIGADVITGGQTRHQVQQGLCNQGIYPMYNKAEPLPRLPAFGKMLMVSRPIGKRSFVVKHV